MLVEVDLKLNKFFIKTKFTFQGNGLAVCVDNVTYAHSGLFDLDSLEQIKGMVCRSTALPMFSGERKICIAPFFFK